MSKAREILLREVSEHSECSTDCRECMTRVDSILSALRSAGLVVVPVEAEAEAARLGLVNTHLREAVEKVRQYTKGGPDHVSDEDITNIFRVADAALRAGGRVMEWRDISTAPKDGTWLLLWVPSGGWYPGSFNKYSGRWDDGDYFDDLRPTHWMPIPQPLQGSE